MLNITKNDSTIMIDTFMGKSYIMAYSENNHSSDIPIMELRTNNNYVLKINKTCISTYNIEMLANVLENDASTFDCVYMYIKIHSIFSKKEVETFSKNTAITKAAFYNSFNDTPEKWIEFFTSCSASTRRVILSDHICYKHDAKMSGVISMSTYVGYNKYCIARCNNCNNAICKYCYANSLTNQRYNLKMKLIRLHIILTNIELTENDIPVIDAALYPYFRFESFGDLNNTLQFRNYNLIASVNDNVNFTIWTKNPGIIQKCIDTGLVLANNLVIGLSSLYLNTPELDKAKKYPFIRFLFTVYDDSYIKEHNIVINCGARHCISCGICYKYLHEHKTGLYIINERKK